MSLPNTCMHLIQWWLATMSLWLLLWVLWWLIGWLCCFTFPNALFIPPPAALALMAVAGGGDVLGDTGGGDVWDNWKNLFAQDIGQQ